MSTVVTSDPATGEQPDRGHAAQHGGALPDRQCRPAPLRLVGPAQRAADVGVGERGVLGHRTWWVLDQPAPTAPAPE